MKNYEDVIYRRPSTFIFTTKLFFLKKIFSLKYWRYWINSFFAEKKIKKNRQTICRNKKSIYKFFSKLCTIANNFIGRVLLDDRSTSYRYFSFESLIKMATKVKATCIIYLYSKRSRVVTSENYNGRTWDSLPWQRTHTKKKRWIRH